ncbi:hypothetical protein PWK10_07555 [Caloramator sp. Dgby_cultured_2]|nr:hypothetical protein [Caloramator sp. Dgby_cultured_2]WDU84499.1 hypothetical protein PWK10_07555 [Caloramator sp. Dgby_cultured_2]
MKVLKDVPVWAFHGAKDEIVPIEMSKELVDVLRQHNGNVKFTYIQTQGMILGLKLIEIKIYMLGFLDRRMISLH